MNSRQTMLRRERNNSGALDYGQGVAKNDHGIGALGAAAEAKAVSSCSAVVASTIGRATPRFRAVRGTSSTIASLCIGLPGLTKSAIFEAPGTFPLRGRNLSCSRGFPCGRFVMSILLSVFGAWLIFNLAVLAALQFKPLRARVFRRSPHYGSMAIVRHRRWRQPFGTLPQRNL
jgi:hypothetical protein